MKKHFIIYSRVLAYTIKLSIVLLVLFTANNVTAFSQPIDSANKTIDATVIAINIGGRQYQSNAQDTYIADTYFSGGTATDINAIDIKGTDDDTIFLNKRYGDFSYNIPLKNGTYDVTLLFAELTHQQAGARQFDIHIENDISITNVDIFAQAGFLSAYSIMNTNIIIMDNALNIDLKTVIDSAALSGIRISRKVAANGDEDGDGIINIKDSCIFTPPEHILHINAQGCSPYELDTDNDGVIDPYDTCNATPMSELVDNHGCSLSQKDNDYDGMSDDIDQCDNTPAGEIIDSNGCGIFSESTVTSSPFIEGSGLVVIEMESTNYSGDWQRFSGNYSSGNGYLQWMGADYFQTPGNGTIDISVYIQNPGTYRFIWLNSIRKGAETSEHNDSWLKIIANSYYGKRPADNHIVCPVEQDSANDCVGDAPMGSSSDGWFKIYRYRGEPFQPITAWVWRARTSDNDGHEIFTRFDSPGIYTIQISGRSSFHAIDRLVLFRSENASNNVDEGFATSADRAESPRAPVLLTP